MQHSQDVEVLRGLRLDRIIRRDDQHRDIHSGCAGQHLANELFVSRHVDDAELIGVQFEVGIP